MDKLIDRKTDTYIHTKKGKAINANNPLTLIFDLGREYYFDYIYFVKRGPNNYAPKTLTISTSDDNTNWVEAETVTTQANGDLVEINLSNKLHSRYVKMYITETTSPNPGYIALSSVEFVEKNVNYALKNPEYIHIYYPEGGENNIEVNYKNFPYFGHSYILKAVTDMKFIINDTTGIRIKTCNKYDAKIQATISHQDNIIKSETITIKESDALDFPVIITGLDKEDYTFELKVEEGSFDLEYLLYEI